MVITRNRRLTRPARQPNRPIRQQPALIRLRLPRATTVLRLLRATTALRLPRATTALRLPRATTALRHRSGTMVVRHPARLIKPTALRQVRCPNHNQ